MHEYDRNGAGRLQQRPQSRAASGQDDIRCERDQFRSVSANAITIARTPAVVDPHVATNAPAQLLQPVRERGGAGGSFRVLGSHAHQHADAPYALALLRARRERPCGSRAAEQRDELAPFHSFTSSAAASSLSGTMMPSIRALSALMISSNLLACTTGRSAGLAPLSMRPV